MCSSYLLLILHHFCACAVPDAPQAAQVGEGTVLFCHPDFSRAVSRRHRLFCQGAHQRVSGAPCMRALCYIQPEEACCSHAFALQQRLLGG